MGEGENAEMAAFGASDAACTLYPAEHQQAERAALCEGASYLAKHLPTKTDIEWCREAFAKAFPSTEWSTGADGVSRSREIAGGRSRFGGTTDDFWEMRVAVACLKIGRDLERGVL